MRRGGLGTRDFGTGVAVKRRRKSTNRLPSRPAVRSTRRLGSVSDAPKPARLPSGFSGPEA